MNVVIKVVLVFTGVYFALIFLAPEVKQKNIIVILADDLGWSDTQPYGSEFYETPNIQRLADGGMRFTRAYSASPICSPTRAAILTGQYPGRLRFTDPFGHLERVVLDPVIPKSAPPDRSFIAPQTRTRLPNELLTYAELLKPKGYLTGFMGKWHLGRAPYIPEMQGFDVVVGGRQFSGPPGGYFAPWLNDNIPHKPEGSHIDDVLTEEAIRFIKSGDGTRPFLLNLWYYSVHAPFQAKPELIQKYRRKAASGQWHHQQNPVMAAMIETLDNNIGKLLDALESEGLLEDTVIIFASDNGGNEYNLPGGIEATNNFPLKNGKANIYDGGQRVPFIVLWPGVTPADSSTAALVSSVDIFPTILDIANVDMPSQVQTDGVSLYDVLRGEQLLEGRSIYNHFPHFAPHAGHLPASSIHRDNWKLIQYFADESSQRDRFELYDLEKDIGENNDLSSVHADIVTSLVAELGEFQLHTESLLPVVNPRYNGSILSWKGSKDVSLERGNDSLVIHSTGSDPYISTSDFHRVGKNATLEFKIKSDAGGCGKFYFGTSKSPQYSIVRSKGFDIEHDGRWQRVRLEINADSLITKIRIDPGDQQGTIALKDIKLIGWHAGNGRVGRYWDF